MREALIVGSRVILLDGGRVLLDAAPVDFLEADVPLAQAFRAMLDAPPLRAVAAAPS